MVDGIRYIPSGRVKLYHPELPYWILRLHYGKDSSEVGMVPIVVRMLPLVAPLEYWYLHAKRVYCMSYAAQRQAEKLW